MLAMFYNQRLNYILMDLSSLSITNAELHRPDVAVHEHGAV